MRTIGGFFAHLAVLLLIHVLTGLDDICPDTSHMGGDR
jgi:hypothetical protein